MEFLITEQQLNIILEQENNEKFSESMKIMNSFTVNMVNRIKKVYGLNLKMLLTWGTSVGGLVMPLDNYIRNNQFMLNDDQRMLVLAGVVFILFFEGKRGLIKVIDTIKKENIETEFERALQKGSELKVAFEEFLNTIQVSSSIFFETVAYSFLIPIITDIVDVAKDTTDFKTASLRITERLLASGGIIVGRDILNSLIRKLLRKFNR